MIKDYLKRLQWICGTYDLGFISINEYCARLIDTITDIDTNVFNHKISYSAGSISRLQENKSFDTKSFEVVLDNYVQEYTYRLNDLLK